MDDNLKKDIILLFIGAVISLITSWFFYKLPYQPLASYYLEETSENYYECVNEFNKKKYFKRAVDGFHKIRISAKEFEKVKDNLQRRGIDF